MDRLGSWGLLYAVLLVLLGPPGAVAQGKGVRGAPVRGAASSASGSRFDAGGEPLVGGKGGVLCAPPDR